MGIEPVASFLAKGPVRLCEKALFPLFVIAMKVPHFCHPETNRISLTREGSVF